MFCIGKHSNTSRVIPLHINVTPSKITSILATHGITKTVTDGDQLSDRDKALVLDALGRELMNNKVTSHKQR